MAYYSIHGTNPTQKNPLSIGSPTEIERRRATRHHFVSAVEVINVESQKQLISLTRDLSLCGCFVTAKARSPKGTRVSLKIANSAGASPKPTPRIRIPWFSEPFLTCKSR